MARIIPLALILAQMLTAGLLITHLLAMLYLARDLARLPSGVRSKRATGCTNSAISGISSFIVFRPPRAEAS